MYHDKTIVCKDCKQEFLFSADEQEFYAEKGFQNTPERCRSCRTARKSKSKSKPKFIVSCAACGANALVPFQPTDNRPVYCSDCFSKLSKPDASK